MPHEFDYEGLKGNNEDFKKFTTKNDEKKDCKEIDNDTDEDNTKNNEKDNNKDDVKNYFKDILNYDTKVGFKRKHEDEFLEKFSDKVFDSDRFKELEKKFGDIEKNEEEFDDKVFDDERFKELEKKFGDIDKNAERFDDKVFDNDRFKELEKKYGDIAKNDNEKYYDNLREKRPPHGYIKEIFESAEKHNEKVSVDKNLEKFKIINHIPECRRGSHQEAVTALILEYIFNPDLFEYKKQWYLSIYNSDKPVLWEKHFADLKEKNVVNPDRNFYSFLQDRPSDDLRGIKGGLMHLDLYNPDLNISVEVNGCHIPEFFPDYNTYSYQVKNDRKKIKKCCEMSELLLGIPPTMKLNYEDYFDFLFYGIPKDPEFNQCKINFRSNKKPQYLKGYKIPDYPDYLGLWGIMIPENFQMLDDKTKKIVENLSSRADEIRKNLKNPEFMNELLRIGKLMVDNYDFKEEQKLIYSIIEKNPLIKSEEILGYIQENYDFIEKYESKSHFYYLVREINLKKSVEEKISLLSINTMDYQGNFYYIPGARIKINSYEFTLPQPEQIDPSLLADLENYFFVHNTDLENIRSQIINYIEKNKLGLIKQGKLKNNLNKGSTFMSTNIERIIAYENVRFSNIPIEDRLNIYEAPLIPENQRRGLEKSDSYTFRYIYRGTDPFKKIRTFIENTDDGHVSVLSDDFDKLILGRKKKPNTHDTDKMLNMLFFMMEYDKKAEHIPPKKKLNVFSDFKYNIYYLGDKQNFVISYFNDSNPITLSDNKIRTIRKIISESPNKMADIFELRNQGVTLDNTYPTRYYCEAINLWEDKHGTSDEMRIRFFPYKPTKFYIGKEMYPELRDYLKKSPQLVSAYDPEIYDNIFRTHHENVLIKKEKDQLLRLLKEVSLLDNSEDSIIPPNDRINICTREKDPKSVISIGSDVFRAVRQLIEQKKQIPYDNPELLDLVKNIISINYDPQNRNSKEHLGRRISRFFGTVEFWDDLNKTPKKSRIIKYKNKYDNNKTYYRLNT